MCHRKIPGVHSFKFEKSKSKGHPNGQPSVRDLNVSSIFVSEDFFFTRFLAFFLVPLKKTFIALCFVMKSSLQHKNCKRITRRDLFKALAFGSGLKIGLDGQFFLLQLLYCNILFHCKAQRNKHTHTHVAFTGPGALSPHYKPSSIRASPGRHLASRALPTFSHLPPHYLPI